MEEKKFNLIFGDCEKEIDFLLTQDIKLILTDPPYSDYMTEEYKYKEGIIDWLTKFKCKQFIFWTAKNQFPLDYTSIHIWDKITGASCNYERIFERNGGARYKIYRGHRINSTVSAQFAKDTFYEHPSQKPIRLMKELILENSNEGDIIFDPFMGSGTTGQAALLMNRRFIGCEIDKNYFEMAKGRIDREQNQIKLF